MLKVFFVCNDFVFFFFYISAQTCFNDAPAVFREKKVFFREKNTPTEFTCSSSALLEIGTKPSKNFIYIFI